MLPGKPAGVLMGMAAALGLAFLFLDRARLTIPAHLNPWAPLTSEEPPGLFTQFKLRRLEARPEQCLAVLSQSSLHFDVLPDRQTAPDCGFRNAVLVTATATAATEPFSLTCGAALSLALWEKHVLQPAAQREFGLAVTRLEHFGSYACRSVYGREGARRSEHATANALDLAGVVLADGRRLRVAHDWNADAEGRFLRELRDGACRFFAGVLSPDYNAAHHDHFHLDRGPYRLCR